MEQYTKESLLNIIDSIPMLITVVDREGIVFLANESIRKYVNKGFRDVIGLKAGNAFECVHCQQTICGSKKFCDNCQIRNIVNDTFKSNNEKVVQELKFFSEKLGDKTLRISTKVINLENQKMVLLCIEDLTDKIKQQEQKTQLKQLQAAKETIGSIMHEVNQPLQVIMGYISLMKDKYTAKDCEYLEKMDDNIMRLKNTLQKINNIKSFRTKKYVSTEILDIDESLNDDPDTSLTGPELTIINKG